MTKTEKKLARRHLGAALEDMEIEIGKAINILQYGSEASMNIRDKKIVAKAAPVYHLIYCNRRGEGLSKTLAHKIAYKAVREGYVDDIVSSRFLKRLEKAVLDLGDINAKSVSGPDPETDRLS